MDLVIPVSISATWNLELKYVLRSWEKNYKELGNVYIVGESGKIKAKYPWLKKVKIIDCNDPFGMNKDANIIRKVIKVIDTQELSNPFIRSSDDQYLLKEVKDFSPVYSQNLKEKPANWWNKGSRWKNRLKRTYRILWVHKKSTFNYDVHYPLEVRHDFKIVMERYPYTKSIGYTINTLYFNNALKIHTKGNDILAMFELPCRSDEKIKEKTKGKTYMCYSGRGGDQSLTDELKNFIINKYKKKSKFEK